MGLIPQFGTILSFFTGGGKVHQTKPKSHLHMNLVVGGTQKSNNDDDKKKYVDYGKMTINGTKIYYLEKLFNYQWPFFLFCSDKLALFNKH